MRWLACARYPVVVRRDGLDLFRSSHSRVVRAVLRHARVTGETHPATVRAVLELEQATRETLPPRLRLRYLHGSECQSRLVPAQNRVLESVSENLANRGDRV